MAIKIFTDWLELLQAEFSKQYMLSLKDFLLAEKSAGKSIFPPSEKIFNALNLTPFATTKVVILGQDPYHGTGQAEGLSFSVPDGVAIPPSLRNIYKELASDLDIKNTATHLESWARQGVLLLNSVLSVEKDKPASHAGRGWELFTDRIIHLLAENKQNLVFILWGAYAQNKCKFIDETKHLIIRSPHPSPLSASRGFFGSKPFSKTNNYLLQHSIKAIEWKI